MSVWMERYGAVTTATRNGALPRARDMKCQDCGKQANHRHHEDYKKPLEVIYVCGSCHKERHKKLGWGWGTGRDKKIYNFSRIPIGSYATIPDATINPVSALVFKHSARTGEQFKCFTWGENIVVFRLK